MQTWTVSFGNGHSPSSLRHTGIDISGFQLAVGWIEDAGDSLWAIQKVYIFAEPLLCEFFKKKFPGKHHFSILILTGIGVTSLGQPASLIAAAAGGPRGSSDAAAGFLSFAQQCKGYC